MIDRRQQRNMDIDDYEQLAVNCERLAKITLAECYREFNNVTKPKRKQLVEDDNI